MRELALSSVISGCSSKPKLHSQSSGFGGTREIGFSDVTLKNVNVGFNQAPVGVYLDLHIVFLSLCIQYIIYIYMCVCVSLRVVCVWVCVCVCVCMCVYVCMCVCVCGVWVCGCVCVGALISAGV